MRFTYSQEHLDFLRENYPLMMCRDLTKAFNAKFGLNKTAKQIHSCVKNRGIKAGRPPLPGAVSRMLTPEQDAFVRSEYQKLEIADLTDAFNEHFGTDLDVEQLRGYVKRYRIKCGRSGQFEKGHESWNKGTKGLMPGSSTSFKPGHTPANTNPLGHERICSKDGYVWIKVDEPNPYTEATTRYRFKHHVVWEKHNGPIPEGSVIFFLDNDKTNCDIENLLMLSRAELCYLNKNGYNELPEEIKPTFRSLARLISATNAIQKQSTNTGAMQ